MSKNKLVIHLDNNSTKLIDYLKNFAKIDSDLLLDIDPFGKKFVAKAFNVERNAIRFAALPFEENGMQVSEHKYDEAVSPDYRIKLGILSHLPKIIKILERFQDEKDFNIIINYDNEKDAAGNIVDHVAENIQFVSSKLTMKMDGFNTKEFKYITDDAFLNKVYKIENPIEFTLTTEDISSIIKTSDIVKSCNSKKDSLVFYADGNDFYVKDYTEKNSKGQDAPSNFTFKLGTLPVTPEMPIRLVIFRERFVQFLDKTGEDFVFLLGNSVNGMVDRLVMHSTTSDTKLVISVMNEE